jgi:hypothetical protein
MASTTILEFLNRGTAAGGLDHRWVGMPSAADSHPQKLRDDDWWTTELQCSRKRCLARI